MKGEHYLKEELYALLQSDPNIFDFIQVGSLDGLWYWDLENPAHEWMNERFWTLLGYDPAEKEHLVSEWQDLIHPDDLKVAVANVEKHLADPSHPYDQVVRYRHKDGSTVWVRCRGVAIRGEDGAPRRLLGAHNDLTEIKRAEAALVAHAEALTQANEDLERFAYAASHDLQTPLRTIRGFVNLLERRLSPHVGEKERGYVEHIYSAVDSMSSLIDNLLRYSRLEQQDQRQVVDLGDLLAKVSLGLDALIQETEGEVTWGELPSVSAHPTQVWQLVQNLVENALKYREAGRPPRVEVRARAEGDRVFIEISDNGRGIEAQYQERIFDLFQRLDAGAGHGMGLAHSRRIVQLHGGRLTLRSTLGEGSTFSFSLPA